MAHVGTSFLDKQSPGIAQDDDHAVATQEHFGDEAVAVDGRRLLLALTSLRNLRPHLLDVLEHHVAVPVKGFHAPKQLLVVPAVDEHLRIALDALRKD